MSPALKGIWVRTALLLLPFSCFLWLLLLEPDSYSKTFLLSHTLLMLHDWVRALAACREGADICLNWSYLCKSSLAPPCVLSLS